GRFPLPPETADEPEDARDERHHDGKLDEEEENADDAAQHPKGNERSDDTHGRHRRRVAQSQRLLALAGSYLFAHRPNATFPPWVQTGHSGDGAGICSPTQRLRASSAVGRTPPKRTNGAPAWRSALSEKPTTTWPFSL